MTSAVWDDPTVDWAAFDLAVIRSCWDYVPRRDAFVRWARRVDRLANPATIIDWNTDKRYLRDLEERGIPIVPTSWIEPGDAWEPPPEGESVVKPAVSISSRDTGRYRGADAEHRQLAHEHVRRLQGEGRTVMVQPYLPGVEGEGETSLVYFGGVFSHAVRRSAALDGPDRGRRLPHDASPGVGLRRPTTAQRGLAERALAAAPGGPDALLYARVDLVPDAGGNPLLIELELTEPTLFLAQAPEAAEKLAEVIAARAGGTG